MTDYVNLEGTLAPRPVRYFDQIGSTNDEALAWLRDNAPPGAVVVADEQTSGRGRMGRGWQTPPHSALALSYVLYPPPTALNRVSMIGALAIAELTESLGAQRVGIKWPNDVQIAGLKVSGVLPESAWDGERLLGSVLGLGVNVRVDFTGTPLAETATSLQSATASPLDRVDLLRRLLDRLDHWTAHIESDVLFTAWSQRLTTIGHAVTVSHTGMHGTAEAVDAEGALLVRDAAGIMHRVIAGDIALG